MAVLGPCFCLSSRTGTLVAGIVDVIIGLVGISLVILSPAERHWILDPNNSQDKHQLETVRYDTVKDTFQFLIEFWLPGISLFFLGIVLIVASITKSSCTVISSFVLSTILIAGSIACLLCLFLSGANWMGIMPYLAVTLLQCFFYVVVVDFSRYEWELKHSDDKEMLVISKA